MPASGGVFCPEPTPTDPHAPGRAATRASSERPSLATAGNPMPGRLAADRPFDLPLRVPLRHRLPLVVLPLTPGQANLDLRVIAREVHPQRNQRVSLLPHLADQGRDLLVVKQQLARSHRVVIHQVRLRVWRDVNVLEPRFFFKQKTAYEITR